MVQQQVRSEVRSGTKRRYWNPADGHWTLPLASSASEERFYVRTKGYLLMPPGELAIYVSPRARDSQNPDPRERAREQAKALTPPLPTGEKTIPCPCGRQFGKVCATWEEHYKHKGWVVDHMLKDEVPDQGKTLTDGDIAAVVERLVSQGYKITKDEPVLEPEAQAPQEPEAQADGDNDNSTEEVLGTPERPLYVKTGSKS